MQQQLERTQPKRRNIAELVIACFDLLVGLPASYFMTMALQPPSTPRRLEDWLVAGPMLLAAVGMLLAGLFLLLRQRTMGRLFQWLAALGGLGLIAGIAYNQWLHPINRWESITMLLLGVLLLGSLGLALLPLWLQRLDDEAG